MKIIVFTGGGIAPALNATLYGIITEAQKRHWQVFGGLFGWASLLPHGKIIDLSHTDIRSIQKQGGSFLRSSRTNPLRNAATTSSILRTIERYRFDGIIPIGGDDTLGAAHRLAAQHHLPIIGVPKTVDNDLACTYFTPGFPTAAATLARYTDALKQAAYGAKRIFVIEVMGGKAGWLSTASALGGADCIIPPERPVSLARIIALTKKRYKENGSHAVVVVAHQARIGNLQSTYAVQHDAYGIKRAHLISIPLRDAIEKSLGIETLIALPANIVSAADPIPRDQTSAEAIGRYAVGLIAKKCYGYMVAVGKTFHPIAVPLAAAVAKEAYHALTPQDFDFKNLRPRPSLLRYLEAITGISRSTEKPYTRFLKKFAS
ncbi:MAG: 6-phosphofructokinase [bacterium]|nr:6-phosphofructokinase [bacterium]